METRREVREGADGRPYLWEVSIGAVEGEGAAVRVGELTMVTCTAHELSLREKLAAAESALAKIQAELDEVLLLKAEAERIAAKVAQ